jgi:broad specificity phosphatase PhoE
MPHEICLIRHGETEWSLSGAHTSRTDLPLTSVGCEKAAEMGRYLANRPFALVLTSPLLRARETCRLAGYGDQAQIEPNLHEWDYGDYEGLTTAQIQQQRPGWNLWRDGTLNGETIDQAAARTQAVISRALDAAGDVALFAHGHILRILGACWIGLPPNSGRLLALSTATLSTLGYERETRVITSWNLSISA